MADISNQKKFVTDKINDMCGEEVVTTESEISEYLTKLEYIRKNSNVGTWTGEQMTSEELQEMIDNSLVSVNANIATNTTNISNLETTVANNKTSIETAVNNLETKVDNNKTSTDSDIADLNTAVNNNREDIDDVVEILTEIDTALSELGGE